MALASLKQTYKAGRDWSTDGCSSAPDRVFGINLLECCAEHDFYYRNDVGVSRFKADNILRKCIAQKVKEKLGIKSWILATLYFTGVRIGGASSHHSYLESDQMQWFTE